MRVGVRVRVRVGVRVWAATSGCERKPLISACLVRVRVRARARVRVRVRARVRVRVRVSVPLLVKVLPLPGAQRVSLGGGVLGESGLRVEYRHDVRARGVAGHGHPQHRCDGGRCVDESVLVAVGADTHAAQLAQG